MYGGDAGQIPVLGAKRTILSENATYGPQWRVPTTVLGGRLFKFGGQFDF